MTFELKLNSATKTENFGESLGRLLRGGEVIELISDLGGGKTTFTRGLARGLGSLDTVQSPSFTISLVYKCREELELHHYDFYRLDQPGVVAEQLSESVHQLGTVTVIEWAASVLDRLKPPIVKITIKPTQNLTERHLTIEIPPEYKYLTPAINQEDL